MACGVVSVPSSASTHAAGRKEPPRGLRAAGLVDRLPARDPWRPPATSLRPPWSTGSGLLLSRWGPVVGFPPHPQQWWTHSPHHVARFLTLLGDR